jgi:hypothetical protein
MTAMKRAGKGKKRADGRFVIVSITSVTVTCAPGTMVGTKNVTVTAGGLVAPLGPPSTCAIATVTAALTLNGTPVGQQQMAPDSSGNYVATWFNLPAGTYQATVTVNWQIMMPESKTSAQKNCP